MRLRERSPRHLRLYHRLASAECDAIVPAATDARNPGTDATFADQSHHATFVDDNGAVATTANICADKHTELRDKLLQLLRPWHKRGSASAQTPAFASIIG